MPCKTHKATSLASAALTCSRTSECSRRPGCRRQLRRLLDIGVIKRMTWTYRYYLTKAGRAATAAAGRLTAAVIVPAMT